MSKNRYMKQLGLVFSALLMVNSAVSAYVPEKTSNKYTSYRVENKKLNAIRFLDEKDEKVAENEYLILYVNKQDLSIKVYDKAADYYYSSNDINNEGLNKHWNNYVNSPVIIKTLNDKMQIVQETIYDAPKSTMKITKQDKAGFTAELYFATSQITVSYSITLDGKDIVFSVDDESIKEEATQAILAADKAKKAEMEEKESLSAKEKALLKKQNKTESHDLYGIQLYPFFGAVQAGEQDGYTFIPDGSGALIRYDKAYRNISSPYDEAYLEEDSSISRNSGGGGYTTSYYQSLLMPIYGMVHGIEQAGFLNISEKGFENARLISYPAGLFTDFYFTTNEYRFNGVSQQQLSATQNISVKLDERLHYDIQERVHFLSGEEADYTGQALYYKDYLLENNALNTVNVDTNPLMMTTSMGAVEKGIIGNKVVELTTTDEIVEMNEYFSGNGIENVHYILKDATLDLYTGKYKDRKKLNKKLEGDKYSFEEMNAYLRDNGSRAFIDTDIAASKGKVNPDQYILRKADKNYGVYKYTLGNKAIQDNMLNANGMLKINELNTALLENYGFEGINNDWGFRYSLYTSNGKKGLETRNVMLQAHQQIIESFATNEKQVSGAYAPFYTFGALTAAQYTPVYTTQYAYITDTIPFYEIVLSGNVPMYSSPINYETDLTEAFLRCIEYNVYPSFEVISATSEDLPPQYFAPSGKGSGQMLFSDWSEQIVEFYTDLDDILSNVKNEQIINHNVIAPSVVEVEYSNGKKIIVNYSNKDFEYEGIQVEKRGCTVI